MKRTIKILCSILALCVVAACLTLLIGGRDVSAPDVSDLIVEKQIVPDDQNAFQHLMKAADTLVLPSDLDTMIQFIDGKQVYEPLIAEILKKNEPAFPAIHKALSFDRCQAASAENFTYISKYHHVAILLAVRAVHDLHQNHIRQSIQSATALLRLGDMLHVDAQNLTEFGAAVRILQLGLNQAGTTARMHSISNEDLMQLSNSLAALRPLDRGLTRAFQTKFKEVADQIDGFRASHKSVEQTFSDANLLPIVLRKTTWFPGYLFKANVTKQKLSVLYRDTIQNTPRYYSDMKIYDLTQYLGLVGSKTAFLLKPNFVGRLFYAFTTPEIDTYLEGKCQMEGTIAGTRLIVAIQSFRQKHGKLPDELTDLCPEHLPSVPPDPFDGKPFRYSAAKALVYSVSKDLKDSDGSSEIPPGEIYGDDYPRTWIAFDGVFKIDL